MAVRSRDEVDAQAATLGIAKLDAFVQEALALASKARFEADAAEHLARKRAVEADIEELRLKRMEHGGCDEGTV